MICAIQVNNFFNLHTIQTNINGGQCLIQYLLDITERSLMRNIRI